jgi:hypothetical protein
MGKEIETRNILCKEEEEKIRKKLAKKKYREKNKLKLRSLHQLWYKRNNTIEKEKRIERYKTNNIIERERVNDHYKRNHEPQF